MVVINVSIVKFIMIGDNFTKKIIFLETREVNEHGLVNWQNISPLIL